MINQIQLRGISRTPSDRMTSDGGCAESLNVHLDNTELAPTLSPVDVTGREGLPVDMVDDVVFIHKTPSYEHYICSDGDGLYWNEDPDNIFIDLTEWGGELVDITAVGNTLIVQTNEHKVYSVFTDGAYMDMGSRIPEPEVSFTETEHGEVIMSEEWNLMSLMQDALKYGVTEDGIKVILGVMNKDRLERYRKACEGGYLIEGTDVEGNDTAYDAKAFFSSASSYIWSLLEKQRGILRGEEKFCCPVLMRYAVKLYDNSYIYQSIPIILGANMDETVQVQMKAQSDPASLTDKAELEYSIVHWHKDEIKVRWNMQNWKDVVKSVDIFLSTDIGNPVWGDLIWAMDEDGNITFKSQYEKEIKDLMKEEILSKANFYKVESLTFEDETEKTVQLKPIAQDLLVVQQTLPDGYLNWHETSAVSGLSSYNERLILKGLRTKLYEGPGFLQGLVTGRVQNDNDVYWRIKYFVRLNDGTVKTTQSSASCDENQYPYGIFFYPDPRCFKIEVDCGDGHIYSIRMTEHPRLNMSYAFGSFEYPLTFGAEIVDGEWDWRDDDTYVEDNVVIQSEPSNPFLFTASNRLRFPARVSGVATTTKALSTGQFGAFPIYIFTEDGIYAASINDVGSIVASHPVSRDVAIEGTVTPIDQAIIFVSDKGVMMLTGSDIKCISPNMNGRHYTIEGDVMNLLSRDKVWVNYIPTLIDSTPFMEFMKKSGCIVDYAGSRVIFFAEDEPAQYVYQIDTDTWHKMVTLGLSPVHALNSYPEAFVVCRDRNQVTHLLDYTTTHEVDREKTRCIAITRAIDLDKSDIRKAVKDIRVRGDHSSQSVRYILLGSMDGRSYGVLPTLRGGSYKYFRVVVLADLSPTERISYIEIDYDDRFTNRLR